MFFPIRQSAVYHAHWRVDNRSASKGQAQDDKDEVACPSQSSILLNPSLAAKKPMGTEASLAWYRVTQSRYICSEKEILFSVPQISP